MVRGLYMDVHVPSVITEGLRRRGIDVLTSQDDSTREADDEVLLTRATSFDRLLFTQDDDFLKLAPKWQSAGKMFTGIVFAHQLGASIGRLIEDLELLVLCATEDELNNCVTYLPLR
jgi:predicted nuclease of predicted toxin-antitoxin system